MADQTRKAEQFRRLHLPGKPLILFNVWDAGSAKVVATGGAKAIATGSWPEVVKFYVLSAAIVSSSGKSHRFEFPSVRGTDTLDAPRE